MLFAQNGGLVYLRQWQAEQTLVAINRSESSRAFELDLAGLAPDGAVLRDLLKEGAISSSGDKIYRIQLAPMSGAVFQVK